jgi:hypothetical protein
MKRALVFLITVLLSLGGASLGSAQESSTAGGRTPSAAKHASKAAKKHAKKHPREKAKRTAQPEGKGERSGITE